MGARQSKRSVDITTTPKKEGLPAEGGVVGDAAAPGDGKLERIEEADTKPTTNGIAPHTEAAEDKEKDKDETTEKEKEPEEIKAEEAKQESTGESPAEDAEVTTPTEGTPASPNAVASPDNKEAKKKDKKKKWSFRSISFSKKDKTKPSREETRKNGDVPMDGNMSVQEPLAEGGEEAENTTAAASSPTDEKSAVSSPADEQVAAPVTAAAATSAEAKEEAAAAASPVAAAAAAAANPAEEKKEEPTPSAPTPVPSAEDKKEEAVEKVEAEKKVVENAPEVEAPVENNVAHDTSTTDCNDEPPKVAPPAVPTEAPASPPTAPAITEDVASVTKAIEEIDISDKAVAAAVNEAIECNTNEIIADAHHQNNINEYE